MKGVTRSFVQDSWLLTASVASGVENVPDSTAAAPQAVAVQQSQTDDAIVPAPGKHLVHAFLTLFPNRSQQKFNVLCRGQYNISAIVLLSASFQVTSPELTRADHIASDSSETGLQRSTQQQGRQFRGDSRQPECDHQSLAKGIGDAICCQATTCTVCADTNDQWGSNIQLFRQC